MAIFLNAVAFSLEMDDSLSLTFAEVEVDPGCWNAAEVEVEAAVVSSAKPVGNDTEELELTGVASAP